MHHMHDSHVTAPLINLHFHCNISQVDLQALLSTYDNLKLGSIQAGVVGFEINLVNTIVGVFIATGQDVAAAIESSNGLFIVQPVTQDEMESRILS